MKDAYGNPMPENIYDKNDTTRMLGYNYYSSVITPQVMEQMNDIVKAYPYRTTTFDTAMDMVVLGYILGKRAERARRKKQERFYAEETLT